MMSGCQPTDTENEYLRKAIKEALDMCEEYKKKNPTNILNDIIEDKYSTPKVKQIQDLEEKIKLLDNCILDWRLETQENLKYLEERIKELHSHMEKIHEMINLEDRITARDVLNRLTLLESSKLTQELDPHVWVIVNKRLDKLEDMSEYKKIEASLFEGAQTHASILRCEAKIKELEQSILETRIQFIEQLGNDKKPHKCPVCDSQGWLLDSYLTDAKKIDCHSCEGHGIVWR